MVYTVYFPFLDPVASGELWPLAEPPDLAVHHGISPQGVCFTCALGYATVGFTFLLPHSRVQYSTTSGTRLLLCAYSCLPVPLNMWCPAFLSFSSLVLPDL